MEEEKDIKNMIPLSEEKIENNNHLGDKLIYHFFPPLLIGVIGGIIIYIVCSMVFTRASGNNSLIKNSLFQLNLELNEQLILQVDNYLMYRTQIIFDLLRKIENTTKFFADNYNKDNTAIKDYINKYTMNINKINDDTEKNEFMAVWGLIGEANNEESNSIDENIEKDLYSFSALIPMLNAMYKSTNSIEDYIENIFIIMNKNELFFDYPLTNDTIFRTGINRAFCFNELKNLEEKIMIPSRYDYHCQFWFSDAINLHRIMNTSYYISPPYYVTKTEKVLIITMCLNSTLLSSSEEMGDYYLICINVRYQIILNALELINHKIYGYFFITRVFNQRAFYYPKSNSNINNTQTYYFDNFNVEEFQLNDEYYLDELNEYINNRNSFINSNDDNQISGLFEINNEFKGEFNKNNKKYYYFVFPLLNHLSDTVVNLLNIVFIYADETTENIINNILNKLINTETLLFIFIVFVIQAIVVMILMNHLIRAIALNIVLPMKNIKKIFEKFNNENEGIDHEEQHLILKNNILPNNSRNLGTFEDKNKNRIKHHSSIRNIYGLKKRENSKNLNQRKVSNKNSIKNKNSISQNISFKEQIDDNDDFLNNYKDKGSDSEDEENYINIKSKDIQDLFCKMINVKNSLDTLYSEDQNNIKKLPDILFASEIFDEIKNENAKNICLSNIANIFLKLKKYDIAIMHLIESEKSLLENEKSNEIKPKETNLLNNNNILKNNKKIKQKTSNLFHRLSITNDQKINKEDIEQKITEKFKVLIESRYPKIIYCYKKFFKNLKKAKKMNLTPELAKNKLNDYEFYISKNIHMLDNFKEYIEKYVELCQIEGNYLNSNNRYAQALLEKIEFIIKYEISENNLNDIEEQMDLLHELFTKVKKLIKGNKEIIKPKNILKFLLKEEFTNELDEIPNSILLQRLRFYKGKLALKCGHYMVAIKKFQKVFMKSSEKITDIKISFKSYKKLIKIAELMKENCNYNNKKNEENLLNQYIIDKKRELQKFVSTERNFIILISTNAGNIDFFINSLENTSYIIDNYIKDTDRYSIAFASSDKGLGGGIKILAKLEEKKKQNNDALLNYIQDIKQDYELLSNFEENSEDDIKFILQNVKIYNNFDERKTFYIFFGVKTKLNHESINFLIGDEINNFLVESKEKLILIMHETFESNENKNSDINTLSLVEEKEFDINKLNNKICSYIHFDDVQKIKDDVMMYGKINSLDNYFNYEKYEMKKYD